MSLDAFFFYVPTIALGEFMADEMINQSTSETEETGGLENMFVDDSETSETEETTEETSNNENSENEEANDFLSIRYNGNDMTLTQEQAVMLAQKGMNYDKVKGKLDSLENGTLRSISQVAERAGLTLDEYAQRLNDFQEQSEIQQIANEYQQKHPDVDDDAASEYANAVYQNKREAQAKKNAEDAQKREQQTDDYYRHEVERLYDYNPNIEIDKLDVEVIDDINAGLSPLEAYLRWENKALKNKATNSAVNAKNKKNANSLNANSASTGGDPFLEGLLGK